jgi:hypothetical protein
LKKQSLIYMEEVLKNSLSFIIVFVFPTLIGLIVITHKHKQPFPRKALCPLICTAGIALMYMMLCITNVIQPDHISKPLFIISLIISGAIFFIPWMIGSYYLLPGILNIIGHIIQGIEEFWKQITHPKY